ncbi:hypothetical protein ACFQX6_17425 [Streptosporangium lutulentum]
MSLHPQAEAYLKLLPADATPFFSELTPELIAEMRTMDAFVEQRGRSCRYRWSGTRRSRGCGSGSTAPRTATTRFP